MKERTQGQIQGGLWGLETPFQIVLILKQALQIIILICAKIISSYFKVPEPARLCLGIHIRNNALAHRAFFITKILVKLLTWNQLATVMDTDTSAAKIYSITISMQALATLIWQMRRLINVHLIRCGK